MVPQQQESIPEGDNQAKDILNTEEVSKSRYGLRKRAAKTTDNVKNGFRIPSILKPQDPHIETPANRPFRAGRLRKPLPCLCHPQTVCNVSLLNSLKILICFLIEES